MGYKAKEPGPDPRLF